MSEARWVRVAVPVPLRQLFTYAVPPGAEVAPGCRVRVPFGPRKVVGLVVEGPDATPPADVPLARVKPLAAVLDPAPVLDEALLRLCGWMASYYHLPPGEAYLLPLPPAMSGGRDGRPREHVARTEQVAHWAADAAPDDRLGTRMDAALSWLRAEGPASLAEVRDATGAGPSSVRRLAERGLVRLETREVPRDPFAAMRPLPHPAPEPTAEQRAAIAAVREALGAYRGFLLMGVTGSGKTEVYLRLIAEVAGRGEGALVLVPEIALTPQLVGRFRARLGDRIAVLHSGLDPAARHEQWLRIAAGELPVVIGARSALFAPLPRLGLVVVDEEHEASFKQDTAPRYHARDLALVRGSLVGCPVLLGSATPSLESWANVTRGKLDLLSLSERALARPMPAVDLVDMRTADLADPDGVLSCRLLDEVAANVAREEQTILFLNRRGFASFLLCRACGEALTCPDCSVSFTWHRGRARLVCHWCDRVEDLPPACPACGDDALQEVGFGTERVQAVLRERLPGARVERMDRDTTRGHALTRLLDRFRHREIDILVGTQMVAKGHDFPGVTLVGVLLAEMGLRMPDFRAAERTFQLMTQIAGRAGRAERPGRVLVQTYLPEHFALGHAVTHDTAGFLAAELADRRDRGFPPWTHLALFRLSGADADALWGDARRLGEALRAGAVAGGAGSDLALVGPHAAPIERIKGRWRVQILVRARTRAALGPLLERTLAAFEAASGVQVGLDVDPQTFL